MPEEVRPGVLVVDDDQLVRESLGPPLRRCGFAVWLAASGEEAVAIGRQHGGAIGAVLLDVRMPGLDGPQTLDALRAINPAVRCCFMSGYIEGYSREELLAFGAEGFLLKPFSVAEVTRMVRQLLRESPPGSG
jgi:CheY-like chemotaxis protein